MADSLNKYFASIPLEKFNSRNGLSRKALALLYIV